MGPTTFSDLDSRPDCHEHWAGTVEPLVERYGTREYWRMNDEMSHRLANYEPKKIYVEIIDVRSGKWDKFEDLVKKAIKVFQENNYEQNLHVYYNAFSSNDGRDVAFIMGFNDWAWLDDEGPFRDDYITMYGEDAWEQMQEDWDDTVEGSSEEIREIIE